MLKEFMWKAFENTGNIDAYMFLKEIESKSTDCDENNSTGEEVVIN